MINQLISRSLGISCILVFALLGAPRSSAIIIANWDHPTKDLAPTVVDPNVTATSQSLVPQDQVNLSSTTAIYTNINGNAGEIWFCGWDYNGAPNAGQYYEVTITPNAGYEITFDQIRSNGRRGTFAATNLVYAYSLNGFGTQADSPVFTIPTSNGDMTWNFTDFTTTLPVTFRTYLYNELNVGDQGDNSRYREQIMEVTGTVQVVVPEPSAALLLGVSGLVLWWRRSKRMG